MADKPKDKDILEVSTVDVEPLSDEDLESASGGEVGVVNNVQTGCPVSNTKNGCCGEA